MVKKAENQEKSQKVTLKKNMKIVKIFVFAKKKCYSLSFAK